MVYIGSPPRHLRAPTSMSGRCRGTYDELLRADWVSDDTSDSARVWGSVRRAQDGDREAFGQLYLRYVDQVFHYLYLHLGDLRLAEDFTSETFLRAFRRIRSLHDQGHDPAAWFVTIAHNILRDHRRSSRARHELLLGELPEGSSDIRGYDPEAWVLHQSLRESLHECLAQLGRDQRQCIALRFLCGLSVTETAQVMGRKSGAVKALQYRALRRLAELLPASVV